jgi:glycosyltransferase involved in cell wall biosynthesis
MVSALENAGYRCVVYIQDPHGWSIEQHRRTIRQWWPWVSAEVRDYDAGVEDCQVLFATSWVTAYAVLRSNAQGVRAYFVQDFEPDFYSAGSESLLAEATYRFGFYGVTAGRWLATLLERDYGMTAESFDFGCDLDSYHLDRNVSPEPRTGVCYYCRPSTPRRAHELSMFALELFATRHPEIDIHIYGEAIVRPHFRAIHHGLLAPADLGRLYNKCIAGLVLSATNVSLVPYEMLAAGCIPVVNEAEQNRLVLANDHIAYALATPYDLANALAKLVERPVDERVVAAEVAAASVKAATWSSTSEEFVQIVERIVERSIQVVAGHP